jgi:hypothetical protein
MPKLNCFYDDIPSFSMYYKTGILFAFLIFIPLMEIILAETNQSNTKPLISNEIIRHLENEKIHYKIMGWQNSENPIEYAKVYDLLHKDGKILVYIYLKDPEFLSVLSSKIRILEFDGDVVTAFVTSEELYHLAKLEFVEKITPPESIQKLQEPIEPNSDPQEQNENSNLWILGLITIIISTIIILKKIKQTKK